MRGIGYSQLSAAEKEVYERFEQAFASYASCVDGSNIDRKINVMKILQIALGDNPQIVYFNKTKICTETVLLGEKKIKFLDAATPSQAKRMQAQLEAAAAKALDEITAWNPISNYDKLICIYEYLQDHVIYDMKELESCATRGRSITPMSHNAYGPLIQGTGVCDGISSAFCLLAKKMGFECTTISGNAAFIVDGFSEHSWSVIKIADCYYHVDPTWDVNNRRQTGEYSYEYFCVSDDSIAADHNWDVRLVPICPREDSSYYVRNHCLANNLTQLEEIFRRIAKSKQKVIRAKLADGIAIPEPENKFLGEMLAKAAISVEKYATFSYTWNKNSRCFYAKFDS